MLSASQIASQILNQLWVLDPAMSAEVGTPERKIVEAVAETIASSQVDYAVLGHKHDLDAMSGSVLDSYLGQLGFGRQMARPASGIVTFSRSTPALEAIVIPNGTQLRASTDSFGLPDLTFVTTATVVLAVGSTSVDAPVRCLTNGTIGNVAANTVQSFAGFAGIIGITSLTNTQSMTGGVDGESDAAFKLRFKNSIFRNMSGTYDHILALALSSATVGKANVVGPLSRYHEYMQVPSVSSTGANEVQEFDIDSSAIDSFTVTVNDEADATVATTASVASGATASQLQEAINDALGAISGIPSGRTYASVEAETTGTVTTYTLTFIDRFGRRDLALVDVTPNAGTVTPTQVTAGAPPVGIDEIQTTPDGSYDANAGTVDDILAWPFKLTTVLSTIPYAKHVYHDNAYLTNGTLDPGTAVFHRPFVDFAFNAHPAGHVEPAAWSNNAGAGVAYEEGDVVHDVAGTGVFVALNDGTSATAGEPTWAKTTIGDLTTDNDIVWAYCGAYDPDAPTRYDLSPLHGAVPNATILGVQAADGSPAWPAELQPGDLALMEHQYISRNSRNDYDLGILNAIDIYVNGGEESTVSSVEIMPTTANDLQASDPKKWTFQKTSEPQTVNFRRILDGRPAAVGSRVLPLHWQPILSVPDSISIGEDVFLRANFYNDDDGLYYNRKQDDGTFLAIDLAHYAAVDEVNNYYGTIRARSGMEFFAAGGNYANGIRYVAGDPVATGSKFDDHEGLQFTAANYLYDDGIAVAQALQEANATVTDDVLVHRAMRRYFRVFVTIMYAKGAARSIVDAAIQTSLAVYFNNQFYGAAIQLSDILAAIHGTPGVDNVRWTKDTDPTANRVEEVNASGTPLAEGARYFNEDFFIEDRELALASPSTPAVISRRAASTWGS